MSTRNVAVCKKHADEILQVNEFGKVVAQLTTSAGYDAEGAVSPDGRHIVFTSMRSGDPEIWIMNSDGTDPRQVNSNKSFMHINRPARAAELNTPVHKERLLIICRRGRSSNDMRASLWVFIFGYLFEELLWLVGDGTAKLHIPWTQAVRLPAYLSETSYLLLIFWAKRSYSGSPSLPAYNSGYRCAHSVFLMCTRYHRSDIM